MKHSSLSAIVAGILSSLLAAGPVRSADPEPGRDYGLGKEVDERARSVQRTYQEAGREIGEAHAEALRQPELKKPTEEFRRVVQAEMIRLEPDKKEAVVRRHEVHAELLALGKTEKPTAGDKARFQELAIEYSNLTETLDDLPERVAQTPRVREASAKFRKEILAVMTKLNPRVPELMKTQREALSDYSLLEQELLRKHGGRPREEAPAP